MIKETIIEKVEKIANNSSDEQIRLNALIFLLTYQINLENKIEIEKQKEKTKEDLYKSKEKLKNIMENMWG